MNPLNVKKLFAMLVAAAVAIVVLSWAWRSDLVQELVRPERFWTNKVVLIEIEVDQLRNKVTDCAVTLQKLGGSNPVKPDPAQSPPATGSESFQTMSALCASYSSDLKAAVESLVGAKKKLQQAKS